MILITHIPHLSSIKKYNTEQKVPGKQIKKVFKKIVFQMNSQKRVVLTTTLSNCDNFRTFYNLLTHVF